MERVEDVTMNKVGPRGQWSRRHGHTLLEQVCASLLVNEAHSDQMQLPPDFTTSCKLVEEVLHAREPIVCLVRVECTCVADLELLQKAKLL